jgi:hypothetical protein
VATKTNKRSVEGFIVDEGADGDTSSDGGTIAGSSSDTTTTMVPTTTPTTCTRCNNQMTNIEKVSYHSYFNTNTKVKYFTDY